MSASAAVALQTSDPAKRPSFRRVGAAHQVAEILQDRILAGAFRPGQPLREVELAAEFGVARNTLREALRLLTQEGLTTHEVHRGVTIREHSIEEVQDLYRIRLLLQSEAGTRAGTLSKGEINRLKHEIAAAKSALESGDSRRRMTHNLNFHQVTVNLVGSQRLEQIFRSMMRELRLVLVWLEEEPTQTWDAGNVALLAVLRSGSPEGYRAALQEYLTASCADVVSAICKRDTGKTGNP